MGMGVSSETVRASQIGVRLSIVLIAASARLVTLWLVPEPELPYNATYAYLRGAQILAEAQGFWNPSLPVYTPPLYSICIATVTLFFSNSILAIKLFQIAADSVTALLISFIVRNAFGRTSGNLSGLAWAMYPFAIYPTLYVGTETLFTFFIALSLWVGILAVKNNKWWYPCCAGAVLGLATLTRGTTQFLPLVLPIMAIVCKKPIVEWLRSYLLFLACFVAVIIPWSARNYVVLHEIIPVAANSMPVLMGSSERLLTIGIERENEMSRLYEKSQAEGIAPVLPEQGPTKREAYLMKLAIYNYFEQLKNEPLNLVHFMIKKLFLLWYSTESGHNQIFILGINLLIYLFAIVGLVAGWKTNSCVTMVFVLLVSYFVLLHWLTLALFRFMIPVMPYVIALAVLGVLVQLQRYWPHAYKRFSGCLDR